jgi:hypothetical protein
MALATIPTVSPWAIIYRASGALFADAFPQIFFQTAKAFSNASWFFQLEKSGM